MKIVYSFFSLLIGIGCLSPHRGNTQVTSSYSDVLLIVNDSSRNSVQIADFFAQRRSIPQKNIYHIQIDTSLFPQLGETIDSATFKQKIWLPLENYMRVNNLVDSINYIVTTKGCPLRVTTSNDGDYIDTIQDIIENVFSGLSSFNDCLALINGSDSIYVLTPKIGNFAMSRYYGTMTAFQHDQVSMPFYLTTRLDGYTVAQIESYIMKADSTVVNGTGLFVLDEDPSKNYPNSGYEIGNEWMSAAADSLQAGGYNVLLNTDTVYVTKQQNVIGYTSWGSNDNYAHDFTTNAIPGNTYLNGSIGETYVSTGGRSFNVGTEYGQSLIADWIAEGISAIKGYTDEPYLTVMAEPDLLFPMYMSGFNMAESYWNASPLIGWRQVVIGDPKMTLRPALTTKTAAVDFGICQRYVMRDTQIIIYNTSGVPLTIMQPTNSDAPSNELTATLNPEYKIPLTLSPGDSLVISAICTPASIATIQDELNIPFTVPGNTSTFNMQIGLSCTSSLLKFITRQLPSLTASVGDSAEGYFIFQNTTSKDTLIFTKVGISDSIDFHLLGVTPSDSIFIYPGQTYKLPVFFMPHDTIAYNAHLGLVTNTSVGDMLKYFGINGYSLIVKGTGTLPSSIPSDAALQPVFMLEQNYPNPCAGETEIAYTIPDNMPVTVSVTDALGRLVYTHSNGGEYAGIHSQDINLLDMPSGQYFYSIQLGRSGQSGQYMQTKILDIIR